MFPTEIAGSQLKVHYKITENKRMKTYIKAKLTKSDGLTNEYN